MGLLCDCPRQSIDFDSLRGAPPLAVRPPVGHSYSSHPRCQPLAGLAGDESSPLHGVVPFNRTGCICHVAGGRLPPLASPSGRGGRAQRGRRGSTLTVPMDVFIQKRCKTLSVSATPSQLSQRESQGAGVVPFNHTGCIRYAPERHIGRSLRFRWRVYSLTGAIQKRTRPSPK